MATVNQPLIKKQKLCDPSPSSLLSQDEILKRRRNREEIKSLYDSYRRIRFCVSQKDSRLMPDFEQAYLSLITASRGCASVQRVVAELIPKYASFCPTALEAAAQVSMNMYNWSFDMITKGEDIDGVACQTATACIFGLVDICSTASHEAPTSSVISGICSAVFQNVLTFFASTFEGKDIYQIGRSKIEKLQEPLENFSDVKQEIINGDEPPLLKLFKFRALCLLRIFFSFPKNIMDACFELLVSGKTDVTNSKGAEYFLRQLTSHLNAKEMISDEIPQCTDAKKSDKDYKGSEEANIVPNDSKYHGEHVLSKNSFVEMALHIEPSLRSWMLWRYTKLCESFKSEEISVIAVFLEKIFGSLSDVLKEITSEKNNELSMCNNYTIPTQNSDAIDMELDDDTAKPYANQNSMPNKPLLLNNVDIKSSQGILTNLPMVTKSSPNDLNDPGVPTRTYSSISVPNIYPSPSQQSTYAQQFWNCDGDPASMDVISASNQLWIGSLGHSASETLVRAQFEDFGPLIHFIFVPAKSFALIEYKNLFDAVRAREYMQGSSPWGSCLCIKFMDSGLGSRGVTSNLAIGNSCNVYIGKISTQREKDEILNKLMMAGVRKPHIYDLTTENALLLEFANAEEATNAMAHIRHIRSNNTGSHTYPSAYGSGYYTTGEEIKPPISYSNSFTYKPEGGIRELVSPRLKMPEVWARNFDDYGRRMPSDHSYAGHMTPHRIQPCGPTIIPPQIQPPPLIRPMYYNPGNSWDNSHNSSMMHVDSHQFNPCPVGPFIPSSVTPVSQRPVNSMVNVLNLPTQVPPPPPPPFAPPHSPSPPPPPPPPPSPPPQSVPEPSREPHMYYQWQGALSKSGVRFCTIYATREDSSACRYLNDVTEPSDWPASLDVTKRTDVRHVKATFASTRPHKREVCRLLPSTTSDHKGFHDFISYLKQRECAGVIKIPAGKSIWARLLFILPHSPDTCSLLGISPHPADCLIALVLPKDTSNEGA